VVGASIGYRGFVYHYDGGRWESVTGPVEGLRGVWGSSDRDVFAVGDRGAILHFDGTRWSAMNSGTCSNLRSVWGTSSQDVFAVGDGIVLHFDGATWEPLYRPNDGLRDVWGAAHNDVFCVGESAIHHFNGTAWDTWWTGIWLEAVWGSRSDNVYAGGRDTFLRFNGREWVVGSTYRGLTISDLGGTSGTGGAVYAAGRASGGGIVARFDGTEWTTFHEVPDDGADFAGVWVERNGWTGTLAAVGGYPAVVSVYSDGKWEDTNLGETLPPSARRLALNAVWSPDGRSFFAVGDGGLIVRGER
jgi:hypothetical protein